MGYLVYCNPHPKGKDVSDCVKRSICLATDRDYMEIQRELNAIKREIGAKKFSNIEVVEAFMDRYLYPRQSFPAVKGKPRMNGKRFCEQYSKGRYVLRMAGHLAACINGKIYDTFDCTEKCVYSAWKIRD